MKVKLPKKGNVEETSAADPLQWYYIPIARAFYVARLADAVYLLRRRVKRLLEVGCGSGIFLPELARHCDRLFAFDLHPHLRRTAGMLQAESVDAILVRSDACFLPFPTESMDAIVCMSVLEHLRDLESPTEEFHRVLSPGGIAIVGVPITNLMTEAMFRVSYLFVDARLEDEHVSSHRYVIKAVSQKFLLEDVLNTPRVLPEPLQMYRTMRFRKTGKG
jgi:ubiquinone/menaquinone biosynthesis C-methylase UbiE